MLAVVTQKAEVSVHWHSLFAAFCSPPTPDGKPSPSAWSASATVTLTSLKVPALSGHVAAAWGGELQIACTLHHYPGSGGCLEEHTIVRPCPSL